MHKIKAENEFVIKFANVNGSGSASANQMFAKGVFRMGIPVSPKNIFPSNIQGLPTWFEVMVTEKGYLGRREGIDISVAMNPQSYAEDITEIRKGGYLLYDSSWKRDFGREDITVIGIPLTDMCVEAFSNPKLRLLFKNIVYVGALSYLLGVGKKVYIDLIAEKFIGKEKISSILVEKMKLGKPDSSGRKKPESIPNSDFEIKADIVIKALGFDPENLPLLFNNSNLLVSKWGTIKINFKTMETNLPGVFAAGDIVRGASLVVWAIKDGRDAAVSIQKYLELKKQNKIEAA